MINNGNIEEIFYALDRQIGVYSGSHIALVVCGGTALSALGLVSRTTKDVDVLGQVEIIDGKIRITKINEFPCWLKEAANTVGRDFDLPENWLNLGPASQLDTGLPDGFEERLIKKRYGTFLTVYFISRVDQIFFKLYAALDRGDYHVQDLFALKPTFKEMEEATQWILTQGCFRRF